MKILYTTLDDRYMAITRAMNTIAEIEDIHWDVNRFPVYDAMDSLKPDVILMDIKYVTNVTIEAFGNNPHIKLVLFGQGIPQGLKPAMVIAKPNTSKMLRRNIESDEHITLYMHDSANVIDIFNGEYNENLSTDIGFVFDIKDPENYTNQLLLLSKLNDIAKLKIVGPQKINMPQYLGKISNKGISSFFKSCKMVLDNNGSSILDIAANGGFCMSNVPNDLYPNIKDIHNPAKQLQELLLDRNKSKRKKIAKKAQSLVLQSDTCLHRLHSILEGLNYIEISDIVEEKIKEDILCVLE